MPAVFRFVSHVLRQMHITLSFLLLQSIDCSVHPIGIIPPHTTQRSKLILDFFQTLIKLFLYSLGLFLDLIEIVCLSQMILTVFLDDIPLSREPSDQSNRRI